MQPPPVFLPGKVHRQEEPGGLQSPGLQESDLTEHMHTSVRQVTP